jgi:hypothetical protein
MTALYSLARANGRGLASQCPGVLLAENAGSPGAACRLAAASATLCADVTDLAVGPGNSFEVSA